MFNNVYALGTFGHIIYLFYDNTWNVLFLSSYFIWLYNNFPTYNYAVLKHLNIYCKNDAQIN